MALSVGSLLAGRYEITAPIAVGGMGEVWKARDRVLGRVVAAKVLKSEFTGDPSFLARFRNEARHTAALTHPNIASVHDYGETVDDTGTQQLAFLVMEFVEGQPLVSILHEEGALPVDWTLHVLGQSAEGLSAAHQAGVVHRDIKPGNLMVRPDGVVKLTDFGIAQARDATPLTRTGMVVGTAQYLSPEQAQGMEVTAASDVYSLGVVAYECLSGGRPFDGTSQVAIALAHINRPPPPLPSDVPPAVRLLVERALAKDPADRFPDGGAFAEAIRRVAAGGTLTPTVRPVTTPGQVVAGAGLADSRTDVMPATGPTAIAGAGMPGPGTAPSGPMPPLQAPAADDGWSAGDERAPTRRGDRRTWAWLATALLLLVLLGGGVWWLVDNSGDAGRNAAGTNTTPTELTSSSASLPAAGILLDSQSFIGRPFEEVAATLTAAGLVVTRESADGDRLRELGRALDAGDVAGLEPTEVEAAPGTGVTVFVAERAFTPRDEGRNEDDDEEEPVVTTPQTTTSPPTGSSSSASASTSGSSSGSGSGKPSASSSSSPPTTSASESLPGQPGPDPKPDPEPDPKPDPEAKPPAAGQGTLAAGEEGPQ